jgi:heme/copper-type cytochrome/quinol oxidase subunit 2
MSSSSSKASSSSSSSLNLLHYQQFLLVGIVFVSVWYALLLQQRQQQQHQEQLHPDYNTIVITYAPVWLIISLGLYAVFSVIYKTLTFHDTPEAATELEQHIQQAQQEMIKRGIIKNEK